MSTQVADAPLKERIAKVRDLIDGIDVAMMTTVDESGELHSRPMYTQSTGFDGTVWFFAYADSATAQEIRRDSRVNLGYAKPSDQTYLSLAGQAEVSFDRAKMEELFNPMLEAWFPQGLNTPGIALLKIDTTSAQYWDAPTSPVATLIGLVKSKATGEPQPVGDNEVLNLESR